METQAKMDTSKYVDEINAMLEGLNFDTGASILGQVYRMKYKKLMAGIEEAENNLKILEDQKHGMEAHGYSFSDFIKNNQKVALEDMDLSPLKNPVKTPHRFE